MEDIIPVRICLLDIPYAEMCVIVLVIYYY